MFYSQLNLLQNQNTILVHRERAAELEKSWEGLKDATDKKTRGLNEAVEEQQYNRNIEDFEIWLAEVEAQLMSEDYGKDLTSVQNLQKKHALLEADIASRQVSVKCLYGRWCQVL